MRGSTAGHRCCERAAAALDCKWQACSKKHVSEAFAHGDEKGGAELATKGSGEVLQLLTIVAVSRDAPGTWTLATLARALDSHRQDDWRIRAQLVKHLPLRERGKEDVAVELFLMDSHEPGGLHVPLPSLPAARRLRVSTSSFLILERQVVWTVVVSYQICCPDGGCVRPLAPPKNAR